ncbi:MAG: putative adenine-specific methylase, partial [Deltaproteobacteria bacterium]|nr:putative adenine-specific methylase [Deltaproteobacteria bacterium]
TRDNGDGTMSHEWGHALHALASSDAAREIESIISTFYHVYDFEAGARLADDLLSKDSAFLKRMVSSKKQQRIQAVKDEVTRRFEDVVRKETDYYKTAQAMNADYTARKSEMWARAWEAYIYDNLGGKNNYLVSDYVAAGRVGGKAGVGTMLVYPSGQEREEFNETIQHFVDGLEWSETGHPSLKDGYQTIEQFHELLLKAKLMELLATVEDRYKAIWTSEPSKDGNFWYRYDATAFGPMMQPDDYVGYDKEYKGEGQDGTGAVCYLTQLHPDTILDFKLSNIQYEGENPTYISKEGGGINDGVREDGETTLGEVSTPSDQGAEGGGEVRGGDVLGGGEGPKGPRVPGRERGSTRSDEGAGPEDVHPAGTGGGLPGAGGGRGNYRITDSTLTDPKSIDVRFNNNLSAIKILKQLESGQLAPSAQDKDALARYSGWGGMAELFAYAPNKGWAARADLLKAELDEDEIRGAESSSTSSYYTPVPVGEFMWRLAQRLGFEKGLVLDPAVGGSGVFMGTMPADLAKGTALQGVEMDPLSARIASKLYELANIETKPFQEANKPNNRADLTITNVPFENITPTDKKHNPGGYPLHNYFINKMLNLTAPGSLSMMITTSTTMDNPAKGHLAEYAKKADLVGAIRLPSNIYSGTAVVTDILVFRKKIAGSKFQGIPVEVWTKTGKDESTGLAINKYFLDHPEMVAGTLEKVTGRYGDEAIRISPQGDLQTRLERIAEAFPSKIVEREAVREIKNIDDLIAAPGKVKEGGLYLNDKGEVCLKEMGEEQKYPTATDKERKIANIAKGFVKILDQVRTVLRAQKTETDAGIIKAAQAGLKAEYEAFVKKHGPVNDPANVNIYGDVTDSGWVLALEEYDPDEKKVTKLADIFTKQIVPSMARPTSADTDHDALAMSLDEFGYPNLEYMAKLRGSDVESVMKGVVDRVVENPETGFLETMDEYLSGNVKAKLAAARTMAQSNPEYERNVKLLEAALPGEIPAHRITARIGAPWVQPEHLAGYVAEKMNLKPERLTPVFQFNPLTFEWSMSFKGKDDWRKGREIKAQTMREIGRAEKSVEATQVWGTRRRNFFLLMKDAIEGKRPVVMYYDPNQKKTFMDVVATQAAEAKLQDIQADFGRWLFADSTRANEAVKRFNDIVNTSVPMNADGSHLTFPGKSMTVLTAKEAKDVGVIPEGAITLYPHQPNSVWKYLRNGNIYLAHEVGAGKTLTMAMIAMEAKRIRGKKKVLYVTLNDSTLGQAKAEIQRTYPLANLLTVRVSTNEERKQKSLQKIALNDFDIAIMRQQDLDRIALSPESETVFIEEDLRELREILEEAKAKGARLLEREIQQRIHALEEKLKETVHEEAKKKNLYFDDLGIDLMIVDEAHSYKNVPYATRLSRITGLNPSGSPTAQAFFRKTQYLNAQFPKRDALVLASGTPLTNSIAEMYNLQRMLQPQEVRRQGVWSFDRWLANFGEIGSQLEWDGARGEYKNIVTNRRIVNAGRLLATSFQNIDSVRAEDTPIQRPKIRTTNKSFWPAAAPWTTTPKTPSMRAFPTTCSGLSRT